MTLSPFALALLEFLEMLELVGYLDSHGIPTAGYGHTGPDVKVGETYTSEQASAWLLVDTWKAQSAVERGVTVPLLQHEYDALVLFAFNVGITALTNSSLLKALNQGDKASAANDFLAWNHVQGVVNTGLTHRRKLERALFLDT